MEMMSNVSQHSRCHIPKEVLLAEQTGALRWKALTINLCYNQQQQEVVSNKSFARLLRDKEKAAVTHSKCKRAAHHLVRRRLAMMSVCHSTSVLRLNNTQILIEVSNLWKS